MKRNLTWRLFESLIAIVVTFICFSILEKLVKHNNQWLVLSIIMSISYGIGYFLGRTTVDLSESKWTIFKIDAGITICVWILLAFCLGVVGNMINWLIYTSKISIYFLVALIVGNVIIKD